MSDPFKQASGIRKVLTADEKAEGRLDAWLTAQLGEEFSRSRVKVLIKDGQLLVNGAVVLDPQKKVRSGDNYELLLPEPEDPTPKGEVIPLDILYEDDDLIVISKPTGMVVHPAAGNWTGTLVNALIHHCGESLSGIGGVRRPRIVHRLDKDTTRRVVVPTHDNAHRHQSSPFPAPGRHLPPTPPPHRPPRGPPPPPP
ncbi:RNA pseudouridine synthase, partial [Rhizobium sp. SEMIA 4085]|uniref:S4 domain-containing protein n=1 Tax=Rhizobium sp. SEMIA 4085 TaxID=2137761 RepID=UPI00184AAF1F